MDPDRPLLRQCLRAGCFLLLSGLALAAAELSTSSTVLPSPGSNSVTLPFELQRGHVVVSARSNDTNALPFMLDTGYGLTMLRSGLAEEFNLRRSGRVTIVGIAGEKEAGMFEGPTLDFGGLKWKPRRVAAFPASDSPRVQSRHGILGSGFFKRFVVEIDSEGRKVTLHEPSTFNYQGSGEILPLKFKDTTPVVEATVLREGGIGVPALFEIDSGCDSCLCVGRDFGTMYGLVPTNAPTEGRSGTGGGTRTRAGRIAEFRLGKLTVTQVRAEVFLEGSPADPLYAGHIGWELLRRYRVIFDYARTRLILEPPGTP